MDGNKDIIKPSMEQSCRPGILFLDSNEAMLIRSTRKIEKCMLIAAHGWDVAGARLAGMRAVFVERLGKMLYPLGPEVQISELNMGTIADLLIAMPE